MGDNCSSPGVRIAPSHPQVDYIILEVCSCGASTVKQRVLQILNLRGGSLKTVRWDTGLLSDWTICA